MGVQAAVSPHARAIWWERLGSALRTAIACTIIGCTALYGPDPVRHQIQYPSVAYVTAILIVSDATLGTTLRGFWHALCATVIVVPSSMFCLWAVGPMRFTEVGATVAVVLSAFVVALPACLSILTKRIAFAQLVIIYVGAVVRGSDAGPVSHPVHIAACTALGATGSVLALILPYPRLAIKEVKKQFHTYTEIASERSNLYLKAFLSEDKSAADDLVSQAEPFAKSGTMILRHMTRVQEGVKWEKHRVRDFKKSFMEMGDRLSNMETPINGMKMALSAISSFPVGVMNNELRTYLARLWRDRLAFALKCSISLGLAVLLGMFFDKKNGYWSGLTIAISFVEGRQPIFTVANNRIQGTAIGSVYGVLGSCLLHQFAEIRFIIILPWIVFTSLLQHSQMFGESGGISAVIGALLILGRKNYGPPKEFAIARLTEVSIGLFCMVLLEIILQPVRPATLVKLQVAKCLKTLDKCLNRIPNFHSMNENIKKLKTDVCALKNRIKDANSEPSFWFLPFKASCYDNTQERLSKMVDLMQIMMYNMQFITSLSQSCDGGGKELQEYINGSFKIMQETTSPCVKHLQKIISVKSNNVFDHESEQLFDLESGGQLTPEADSKVMNTFVQNLNEVADKIQGEADSRQKILFHLNSLAFCIGRLVGETMQVERCIKEMIRSENPYTRVEFKQPCYKNELTNSS